MKKSIIVTDKLCKTFSNGGVQQHVLKNLDIVIYEGDFTVIMGSSGSGKSTLMYSLSGMDKPNLGKVTFCDEEISKYSTDKLAYFRRKNCGFVFQQINLMSSMSVLDNILAAGLLINNDRKNITINAKNLLKKVGLIESVYKKSPTQLSGGEAQRVAIVRALINEPKVIFADEPTGALNSATGKTVLDTFSFINDGGQSVIMVTHDIKSARRANRILYLKDGVVCGECDLGKYSTGDDARHNKLNVFLSKMGW